MPTASRRASRAGLPALLAAWAGLQAGCNQCPCYPQPYGCPPMASSGSSGVRYGSVCEAPPASGSVVVQSTPGASRVADGRRPSVVESEPSDRVAGRSRWRRSDPDTFMTNQVEGALDGDTRLR